ncbi:hypothetical protein, partial [uncultured Xanthomonas sp.]|uniref:hypothetical protein n=1 Tax=uncultured Xanthomonas sp. TaxID=152831 RepID=UPI0025EEAC66
MKTAMKMVLVGSMLAALAACKRDGDQPATDPNAANPPAAADGSPAGSSTAPAGTTSGDASGTATGQGTMQGQDASQGVPPTT